MDAMFRRPLYLHLSAILLSFFVTAPTVFASEKCNLGLAGSIPVQIYQQEDSFPGAQRMLTPHAREVLLDSMGGPSTETRELILSVKPSELKLNDRLTLMVRKAIRYVVDRTDLNGYEKAILWEALAVDINLKSQLAGGPMFTSMYHDTSDGSFMFQGEVGETLVIKLNGQVFRGKLEPMAPEAKWRANYYGMTELR